MLLMRASRRVIVALAVALTGLVFIPASCSKKGGEADWKAKIETVNGVRTVNNPETPRYGTFAFDLVEDLAIGDEKNEDYFFPGGATVSIDDHGAFYVCDYGNRRVQVYGRDGKFVRTLGRVGQGPGEYAFPSSVHVDADGNVYIANSDRYMDLTFYLEDIFGRPCDLVLADSLKEGVRGSALSEVVYA